MVANNRKLHYDFHQYKIVRSKTKVSYKAHEEFLMSFSCSIHETMMERKKTDRDKG